MRSVRGILTVGGLVVALIGVCASGAAAQDESKVGVTMGYPASFGIIWHASDRIAIRPELTLTGSSSETRSSGDFPVELTGDGWAIGTGVSALIYLHKYDRLRTYVSPRFTYSHTSTTTKTTAAIIGLGESTATGNAYGGAGSFGAEYRFADKFAVFGEVGFGVTHTSGTNSLSPIRPTTTSWGTRSGVGVTFYF